MLGEFEYLPLSAAARLAGAYPAAWRPTQADGGRLLRRGDAREPRCFLGGEPRRGPAMTRICWWLADIVSRTLEPDERDVVRGDFAGSGETGRQRRSHLALPFCNPQTAGSLPPISR